MLKKLKQKSILNFTNVYSLTYLKNLTFQYNRRVKTGFVPYVIVYKYNTLNLMPLPIYH